jgi:hypothetical protein
MEYETHFTNSNNTYEMGKRNEAGEGDDISSIFGEDRLGDESDRSELEGMTDVLEGVCHCSRA